MKKYLWVFIFFIPFLTGATNEKLLVTATSIPITFLQASFNLVEFSTKNDIEPEDQIKFKELEGKKFFLFEQKEDYPYDRAFDVDSFVFWCSHGTLLIINKKTPNQCVQLGVADCNHIGSINVEKLYAGTFRLFVVSTGMGRAAYNPRTEIWDYDTVRNQLTKYLINGGSCWCASDIENKNRRDLIPWVDDIEKGLKPIGICSADQYKN
jgi:hypothetical protein